MTVNQDAAQINQCLYQEQATNLIKNAWDNNKLASSYLFWGPEGTGRLSLAKELAQAMNCQEHSFPPCLVCSSCKRIEKNIHPDVRCIQKENSSYIKIEQIHQLRKEIYLHPFEASYKVFIILNAEDLTPEASNSLLKVLEEPPKDSLVILIASDLRRIFGTIISRCQKVRFRPLMREDLEKILVRDYSLDKGLSHFLGFIFEGRLGKALEAKQQDLLSRKNEIVNNFITNPATLLDRYDTRDKESLDWILRIIISCVRDVYLLKAGISKSQLVNEDIAGLLSVVAKKYSYLELNRILRQLSEYLENLRQNINPRLLVDNLGVLWKK